MNIEIPCEFLGHNVLVEDVTAGMPFDYQNLECPNPYPCKNSIYCGLNNQICKPFLEATLAVINLPRETTESGLAKLADPCPVGSPEDVRDWNGQA